MLDSSRWHEPFGECFSKQNVDNDPMFEFTVFNLLIPLIKVKQLAIFRVSPVACRCVQQRAAVLGFTFYSAWIPRYQDMLAGMVTLLFMVVGTVQMST